METKLRSLLKAISYRVLGSAATAFLVLVLTKRAGLALSIGVLDSVVKIGAYFLHERVWAKIAFGLVEQPPRSEGRDPRAERGPKSEIRDPKRRTELQDPVLTADLH